MRSDRAPQVPVGLTIVAIIAALAFSAFVFAHLNLAGLGVQQPTAHRHHPARSGPDRALRGVASDAPHRSNAGSSGADVLLPVLLVVGASALSTGGLLTSRWSARRSRRYVRLRLLPHRADDAETEAVRRLLESWHQQLLERWWRRLAFGQPSMALEFVVAPDSEDDLSAELSIVCPEELAETVQGSLGACYPDSRLLAGGAALPPIEHVIRLKKRYSFVRALRAREDDERNLADLVFNHMASLGAPATVQYTLVPAPQLFDRRARQLFATTERRSERSHVRRPAEPGLRSEVLGAELRGGLRVQHRPLFFSDIRIGAAAYADARSLAGTLRGGSGAENRLVERWMRPRGRLDLYRFRMQFGIANPIPGWRRGVLSSTELAGLWHLPSPGMKSVRLERSAVPRAPAPPEVSRADQHTLARDERGSVGILPADKTDGLGLIGGQKTGKTSVLCRTVRADALDPDCAMVVLMPKPGDARTALSMVPSGRTVHYLDLERPQFGINPLLARGDAAMVADKVVEAFRDVNMEGDIRGSSDRYLRQAAQAAIGASRGGAIDGPPTLWHMYRMLLPSETAFRESVVQALYPDSRFTDTATFFGRELPGDLRDTGAQTAAKLDAPRNKILRLMVDSLDKVLRHPIQVSLDEIVARREVLVVDGKMGTFGSDNCRVMMQFILNMLYGALQRQQQRPEEERVRVALKVDEAHLVINESFADALATLRSAGLEVVAAWQYGEQIQDPKIRSGMMSLLRQRCMFSMGEEADAREMTTLAMSVYTDQIRPDVESRARLRLTPDTIFNLPNHHAICSWIVRGARAPAFVAETLPLEVDETTIRHHLEAQRARGGFVPERLPDPLPELESELVPELPTAPERTATPESDRVAAPRREPVRVGAPGSGFDDTDEPAERDEPGRGEASGTDGDGDGKEDSAAAADSARDSGTSSKSERRRTPAERPTSPRTAPVTFAELDLDDVRGLIWDEVAVSDTDREPTPRELEILGALWSYRFLFATQIWRRWWSDSSQRAAQQGLNKVTAAGWVRRFKFQVGERGAQQRVYCLTERGFDLAHGKSGRHGLLIPANDEWRDPHFGDPRRILRDLHVNGWMLALSDAHPRHVRRWRGARASRQRPPRTRVRGEWKTITPSEVAVGTNSRVLDLVDDHFDDITPDGTVELRVPLKDRTMRLDLLIEFDRARSPAANEQRLRRYDGFLSGWARMTDRYGRDGVTPVVVVVCEDEHSALRVLRIADEAMTGRIAKAGTDDADWPYPGRRSLFVAVERDMHEYSLAAFALPERPPDMRAQADGREARTCRPRRVQIVAPELLRS